MNRHVMEDGPAVASGFAGFESLVTPAVVINSAALDRNLARMQGIADAGGVALHPHIKTHKSLELARRQLAAGAKGLTASRAPEALCFIRAGLGPVTVAYPIVEHEVAAELLRSAAERGVTLRFIADSTVGLDALAAAGRRTGQTVNLLLKVDVGLRRSGVDPTGEAALKLARRADALGLDLVGLLSHAGQAYGAGDRAGIRAIAESELALMRGLAERMVADGLPAPLVSIGSTPTALENAGFDGVHELRPGNYIFLDLTAVRLGLAKRDDVALGVAATVISANEEFSIIDAGSKTLSSDIGPHGAQVGSGFGEVWCERSPEPYALVRLSEEHGFVRNVEGPMLVGSKVLVLPNHACPVVNLAQELHEVGTRRGVLTVDA